MDQTTQARFLGIKVLGKKKIILFINMLWHWHGWSRRGLDNFFDMGRGNNIWYLL